jgi:hypothetical protein
MQCLCKFAGWHAFFYLFSVSNTVYVPVNGIIGLIFLGEMLFIIDTQLHIVSMSGI